MALVGGVRKRPPHPNTHTFGERLVVSSAIQSGNDAATVKVFDFGGVQLETGGLMMMPYIHKIHWTIVSNTGLAAANTFLQVQCQWYVGTETTTTASLTSPPLTWRDTIYFDNRYSSAGSNGAQPQRGVNIYTPAIALPTGKATFLLASAATGAPLQLNFIFYYSFEDKGAEAFIEAFMNQNIKTA